MNESDLNLPEKVKDKGTNALGRIFAHLERTKMRYMSLLLVLWVVGMLTLGNDRFNGDWSTISVYIPQMLSLCSFLIVILFLLAARQRERSTISFDSEQITISHKQSNGKVSSQIIPWWKLKAITSEQKRGLTGPQDVVRIENIDGERIELNLSDLINSVSIGAFANAARLLAPNAKTSLAVPGNSAEESISYTQLWLQYFSTPSKRERITDLTDGLILDRKYKVIGRLGSGGQGTAYLAVVDDGKTHTEVVLKEYILPVHKGTAIMEQTLDKLRKETELLQRLDHPSIVKCLGYFVEDYRGYVILEYVDGESLKEIVAAEGPFTEGQVIAIGINCCDILDYLHSCDPPVIHRDITPDNILRQLSGEIKLVDFNVAHQLESSATATVVGKHCYLPPEQFRGKPVPASDLYALGGTMHFLLTGCEPEPITACHPRTKRSALSSAVDEVIARATCPKLGGRYASADEFRSDLRLLTTQ